MSRQTGQALGKAPVRSVTLVSILLLALVMPAAQAAARDRDQQGRDRPAGPPKLEAKSWILVEQRTGDVLASHSVNEPLPMASTTKLMTAYLAIRRLDPRRTVRVDSYRAEPVESLMGLEAGQRVSVRDLLHGLVMLSGNDAAVALAKAVSGTVPRFVGLMNRTAARLGLDSTGYRNPIGLDAPGHRSSASDLGRLGRILMGMPRFRRIAGEREAVLTSYRPPVEIVTSNDFLLANRWANGVKTGATEKAGYLLVSAGFRRGVQLLGVVMGADSETARDAESKRLLDWGFGLFRERIPLTRGEVAARVPIRFRGEDLSLVPKSTQRVGTRGDQVLKVDLELPAEVEGPIRRGENVGRATVLVDGQPVRVVALVAATGVEGPTPLEEVRAAVEENPLVTGLAVSAILLVILAFSRGRKRKAREALRRIGRERS